MGEFKMASNIKLGRHHTDIVTSAPRRTFDSDIIIEEDYNVGGIQPERKTVKKTVLVSRHNTEVFRKRPPELHQSFKQDVEAKTTRRSLSRHGSRVQQSSRVEVIDEPVSVTTNVLKCVMKNKSADKRRKQLIEITNARLGQHADATSTFDKDTPGFNESLLKLQQSGCIVLTGSLGIGKTFTAINLLQAIVDSHEDYTPIILQSVADLQVVVDTPAALVVLADDFLGKVFYNPSCIASWNRVTNHVTSLLSRRRIFLILTCESESMHFIQSEQFSEVIQNGCVIDLDSEDFTYPTQYCNKTFNLYQKMGRHSQKDSVMPNMNTIESGHFGFPLLCRLTIVGNFNSNLQKAEDFLLSKLEELRNQEFLHYLVLVLTMLFGGRFPVSDFTPEQKLTFDKLLRLYKIEISFPDDLVVVARQLMDSLLFYKSDTDCFEFIHGSFYYAVMFNFTKEHVDDAIELVPVEDIPVAFGYKTYGTRVWELIGQCISPELTQNDLNLVLSRYKSALDSKSAKAFDSVASSVMWRNEVFIDLSLAVVGVQFFTAEDDTKTPFTVHLIRKAQEMAISKLLEFISQYRRDNMVDILPQIRETVTSLCQETENTDFECILSFLPDVDNAQVCAAAKGGNVETLRVLLNNGRDLFSKKNELFETACSNSHIELLEFMFAQLDSNSQYAMHRRRDKDGKTLVHFAAMTIDTQPLEFLVNRGGDPMTFTKDGLTILHISSSYGRLSLVKHICTCYPDLVPHTDNNGFTCAHFAALAGHVDVLQYLLSQNMDPTLLVKGRNTIIHLAAYNGRTEVTRLLCNRYPQLVPLKNMESYTASQLATIRGHLDIMKLFFNFNFDPLCKTVDGRTFLHLAAFHGKLRAVQYLCNNFPDLTQMTDNDGNTAAHDAAASGNIPVFVFITENHINPHLCSYDGCTILHDACYYGRKSTVVYISDTYPAMLNIATNNGYTPLHGTSLGGFVDIFTLLIERGANPYALSTDASCVLHEAAYGGKLKMVQFLITSYPSMATMVNKLSYLPVHFAAQEGHMEVLQYLISISENSMATTEEHQTFLHIACYNGRLDIVKYLCRQFPKMVPMVDANGASAMHYAARGGFVEILIYLEDILLNSNAKTYNDSTMLHLAAYDGKFGVVQYICRKYPQLVKAVDKFQHNAAHYAASSGNLELLQYLLDAGIDPKLCTDNGGNLLLKAAYYGRLEIVKYLCETFPDMIQDVDVFGCNAAHYAVCAGSVDVLKYVLEHHIDPMTITSDGHTMLHIAAFHGQFDMVRYLYSEYPAMRRSNDNSGNTAEQYAKLGEQKQVVEFLQAKQKLEAPKQVGEESTDCVSCCSVKGAQGCLGQISAIFCCCRR